MRTYIRTRAWSDDAARRGRGPPGRPWARGRRRAHRRGPRAARVGRGGDRHAVRGRSLDALGDGVRRAARPPRALGPGHPRRRGLSAPGPARPGADSLRPSGDAGRCSVSLARGDEQRRAGLVDPRPCARRSGGLTMASPGRSATTCSAPSISWTRSTRPESRTTTSSPAGWRSQRVPGGVLGAGRRPAGPRRPSPAKRSPVGRRRTRASRSKSGSGGRRRAQPEVRRRSRTRSNGVTHARRAHGPGISTAATRPRCAAAGSPSGRAPRARRAARCPGPTPRAGGRGRAST